MVNKKDLIIAVLVTFCLAATLFIAIPARSSGTNWYDPWLDFNDDGKVDGSDLIVAAHAYGSSGDPTKNVNVTNFPEDRPLTVKKGVGKISIIDTYSGGSGNGYPVALGMTGLVSVSAFYYCFEPKGILINVTGLYLLYMARRYSWE